MKKKLKIAIIIGLIAGTYLIIVSAIRSCSKKSDYHKDLNLQTKDNDEIKLK